MRTEPIHTANHEHLVRKAGGYRRFVEREVHARTINFTFDWDDTRGEVYAEVINNVWAVRCPFVGCDGSLVAEPGEPYFCPDCLNQQNDSNPMVVVFPVERQTIERLLIIRPIPNRNWVVGEPLAHLELENAAYMAKVMAWKADKR